jgi:hypothetical protein
MVMARVSAIACGYEDANDLDRLRHDPLMKLAVGRCPQSGAAPKDANLASLGESSMVTADPSRPKPPRSRPGRRRHYRRE